MSDRFVPKPRHVHHEPIVPPKDGTAPTWVVVCLEKDCGYAHDVHAQDGADAIEQIARVHQSGHKLIAKTIDYSQHPLYS